MVQNDKSGKRDKGVVDNFYLIDRVKLEVFFDNYKEAEMLKQIRLFLNAAEMLVFNTLFDRDKRTISLTRPDFEKLLNDIKEAKIEGDLKKFVAYFIEEMINCGLLVQAEPASEQSPIGTLRPLIDKDEIAGPQYIVERSVFQIAVPLKLKLAPVQPVAPEAIRPAKAVQTAGNQIDDERIATIECCVEKQQKDIEEMMRMFRQCFEALKIKTGSLPNAVLQKPIQQVINLPERKGATRIARIDRLLMILMLSPFAKSWFSRSEVRKVMRDKKMEEVFLHSLLAFFAFPCYADLFERREISDREKAVKKLFPRTRYYYRLTEKGTAKGLRCLKKYSEMTGVNDGSLDDGSTEAVKAQEEPPVALKVEQAPLITPSEPPAASEMAMLKEIVKSEIFNKMNRRDKVLCFVRVSPLASRWFKTRELKALVRTLPNVSNYQQAMMAQAVEESMSPLARQGYFAKRDLSKPDFEGKQIFSMCRVEFYLIQEGRARAAELLKQFRLAPLSATVPTSAWKEEGFIDLDRIVSRQRQAGASSIDMLIVLVGLSPWTNNWFSVQEFFTFIEQRMNSCPLTLQKIEQVLFSHSRSRRDPFMRNTFIPREDKDIKYRMSRFGMARFFELIKSLNR